MGIQGLFSLCRGAPLLFLFGAIWLILQQKSMSLERAISQGFLFTFIERKTLQYQAFLSIKLVFYLRKQSSKLAKFGGLREGETNKKVTPNTNNDLAPAQNFVLNNPGNPVISGFLGIFLFEWLQIGYNEAFFCSHQLAVMPSSCLATSICLLG